MRLLFDQNLSYRLCKALAGDFPDSGQVHLLGLEHADDRVIWNFARTNGFVLVSQDGLCRPGGAVGATSPVIWLRCGNQPSVAIAALLRRHFTTISAFEHDPDAACLELYPGVEAATSLSFVIGPLTPSIPGGRCLPLL